MLATLIELTIVADLVHGSGIIRAYRPANSFCMKRISVLLFICIGFSVCQAQRVVVKGRNTEKVKIVKKPAPYTLEQLTGKWQEVRRRNLQGGPVDFTDSLQLNFSKRDSVVVRDGITISHKGLASIDNGNTLGVAGDKYSINSLSKNVLVINDGEYLREFTKRKNFYYESMGKIILPAENISLPVAVDGRKLLGKWYVYRTQASPGEAQDSAVIKTISVLQPQSNTSAIGEITYTKNTITKTVPFEASMEKGIITLVTNDQTWHLNAYKADGKEFIFGNQGGLVYFSKKL